MNGISAFGAYVPQMRLERSAIATAHGWLVPALKGRGKGARALADWDEDSVTLAVEAARSALPDEDRSQLDSLVFASTTSPFDLRLNAGIVAAALDLDTNTSCHDAAGSERAGLSALIAALKVPGECTLITAADRLRPKAASTAEIETGHAGAAMVVSSNNVAAAYLGHASQTEDFV
ncbi:MAG: 3-hydroxy-3-methylglutaryl CoA synthase, partial [Pseudomonadota bacterium]